MYGTEVPSVRFRFPSFLDKGGPPFLSLSLSTCSLIASPWSRRQYLSQGSGKNKHFF